MAVFFCFNTISRINNNIGDSEPTMTVEDNYFNIKNGLSVGTGKHQVLDSNAHLNVNYVTLNTGGRYLSAGVDLWDLIATHGIPPLSTNSWNQIHDQFLYDKPRWDEHLAWTISESATNNTDYNRNTFVNVSGDDIFGPVHIKDTFSVDEETYLRGHLRVDGHTYLSAAMYVENDAYVMGDLKVDGNVWLAAEEQYEHYIYVGAHDRDNVVFNADVDSDITPNIDIEYDFGSTTKQWKTLYTQDLSASRDADVTRTLYANTIINNTPDYVSIYGGWDESTGAFLRLSSSTASNPANRNRMMLHADQLLIGDVLDDGNYDPWMVRIHTDDRYIVLGSTLKDRNHFLTIHGDTSIKGNLSVDGSVYLSAGDDGTIYLGTVASDTVVFNADVDSDIIPEQTTTYDLGTSDQQWRELFIQDISATNDIFADGDFNLSGSAMIETDLVVSGHTDVGGNTTLSGTLDVRDRAQFHDDVYIMGNLRVDGNAWLSAGVDGVVNVGDKNTDSVIFHADVDSNIIPDDSITYDLGTSEQQWRELFVQDISATNDIFADGDFNLSGSAMIETDLVVSGHTDVGGNTTLSGTLDTRFDTTLHADLRVSGDGTIGNNFTVKGNTTLSGTLDVEEHAHFLATMTVDQNVGIGTPATSDHMLAVNGGTMSISANSDLDSRYLPSMYPALRVEQLGTGNVVEFYDSTASTASNKSVLKIDHVGRTALNWDRFDELTHMLNVSGDSYFADTHMGINVEPDSNYSLYLNGATLLDGNLTVNEDTVLSGHLTVEDSAKFLSDVHIVGDLRVDGNAWLSAGIDGVINIGDTSTDNIIFRADVDSGIVPNKTTTYDLGTHSQQWRELFVQDISATNDIFTDGDFNLSGTATIETDLVVSGDTYVVGSTTLSGTLDVEDPTILHDTLDVLSVATVHDNLLVSGSTTIEGNTTLSGTLDVQDFTTIHNSLSVTGDLFVDGNAYLSAGTDGKINVGDTSTDNVVFNAYIDSGIVPDDDVTFDLGTDDLHWRVLYAQHVSAAGDVNVDGDVLTDRVINNGDSLSLHAGTDDLDGSFIRLESDKVTVHANHLFVRDISDGVDTDPLVLEVAVDPRQVLISADTKISQNAIIYGNLAVSGSGEIVEDVLLHSNLDVLDTATIHNVLSAKAAAFVDGITTLSDKLYTSGTGTFGGDLSGKSDITIDGTGTIKGDLIVGQQVDITGDTAIHGNLTVDGNVWFNANNTDGTNTINLGDDNTDNIVFNAEIDSNIIPDDNMAYDLGSVSQHWNNVYTHNVSAHGDVRADGILAVTGTATVSGDTTIAGNTTLSGTLDVRQSAFIDSTLDVRWDTTLSHDLTVSGDTKIGGDLIVDGNVWFNANNTDSDNIIYVGDDNTDRIIFNAEIDSNIIPDDNMAYDLGSVSQHWNNVYTHNMSAHGDAFVGSGLYVSEIFSNDPNNAGGLRLYGEIPHGDTDHPGDNVSLISIDHTIIQYHGSQHVFHSGANDDSTDGIDNIPHMVISDSISGVSIAERLTAGGDVNFKQDLHVEGDLVVDGHAYFGFGAGANLNLGESNEDKVSFYAEVDSNIIPDPTSTYDLGAPDQLWRFVYAHKIIAEQIEVPGFESTGTETLIDGNFTVKGDISATGDVYLSSDTLRFDDGTSLNSSDTKSLKEVATLVQTESAENNAAYNKQTYFDKTGGDTVTDIVVTGDIEVQGNVYADHDMMLTRSIEYLAAGEAQYVDLQGNNPNDPQQNSQYKIANWDNISNTHCLVLPYNTSVKRICLRGANTQDRTIHVGVHTNDKLTTNSTNKEYQLFERDPLEIRSNIFSDNYQTGLYTYTANVSAQAGSTLGVSISADGEITDLNVTMILSQRETKPGPPGLYDSVLVDHVEEW